jgi:outer membrane protein OmpA-like peptidoglycan-associated protein
MYKAALFLLIVSTRLFSQQDSLPLKPGDKALAFTISLKDNSSRSFAFPYQKRLMMVHFWSNDHTSKTNNRLLRSIAERYKNSMYKSATGFEVISVAVKTDKLLWKEILWTDSLGVFINGTAKDYNEEVCKNYNVSSVPRDVLIDETGSVIAINPGMKELEGLLSERKVFQPVKKDVVGLLARSLNRDDLVKSARMSLFTVYGDSIAGTNSSALGRFNFNNIKLNQDLILKVANQSEMDLSDPIALYAPNGDFLMNGFLNDGSCEFYIPYKLVYRLLDANAAHTPNEQMNLVSNLEFTSTGTFQLSPKDEQELNNLAVILLQNKELNIEFKTHTDSKLSESGALDVTTRQVQLIKNYFQKKGIAASRIKGVPKGKTTLNKPCEDGKCSEEDHRQNRRVEFVIS